MVNNNSDTGTMIFRIIAIQPKATSWATVSVKVNWLVFTIELFDFAQFFRYIQIIHSYLIVVFIKRMLKIVSASQDSDQK